MGPEIDVPIRGVSYKPDSYIRAFVSHNKEHLRRNQIFCFLIRGIHCKQASYKQVPLYYYYYYRCYCCNYFCYCSCCYCCCCCYYYYYHHHHYYYNYCYCCCCCCYLMLLLMLLMLQALLHANLAFATTTGETATDSTVVVWPSMSDCAVWLCMHGSVNLVTNTVHDESFCCPYPHVYSSVLFFFFFFFFLSVSFDRLFGLVVRRPPRERKIPGSNPAFAGIFSGLSHTSDSKIGIPVATLPGAWRCRVSAGTGRPVSVYCDLVR